MQLGYHLLLFFPRAACKPAPNNGYGPLSLKGWTLMH